MIDAVDRELRERFAALADRTDDSAWLEVQSRARGVPRLRAIVALAATLALAVAVTASAVGVPGRIVRLFENAQPAPREVVKSFNDFDEIVSTDLAGPPREVLETRTGPGETATLWVAPTTAGGYCSLVKLRFRDGASEGAGGECEPHLDGLFVDVSLHGPFSLRGDVLGGPVLVRGIVGEPRASALALEYEDGDTASIPLVWVSEPVATGFFVYAVPKPHWLAGHRPKLLTVRSAGGHELARTDVHGFPAP